LNRKKSRFKLETISGTGEASVTEILISDANGMPLKIVDVGQLVCLRIVVRLYSDLDRLVLGYGIKDRLGQVIYGTNTYLKGMVLDSVRSGSTWAFEIFFHANLGPGTYSVQTALVSSDTHLLNNYEWIDRALIFNVVNMTKNHFEGCAWIDPQIKIEEL